MAYLKSKKLFTLLIIVLALILAYVYFIFPAYEKSTYERYAGKEIYHGMNDEIFLSYKNETINMSELNNSDIYAYLQCLERELYLNDIMSSHFITITVPNKITLKIFPKDDDSVFLEFDMKSGWDRNYIINGENFNGYLEILYKITGNRIFEAI